MKALKIDYTKAGIQVKRIVWNEPAHCYTGEIIINEGYTKPGMWDHNGVYMGNRIYAQSRYDIDIPKYMMQKFFQRIKNIFAFDDKN